MTIKIGLWGSNGHQIHGLIKGYSNVTPVAYGKFNEQAEQSLLTDYPAIKPCKTYEEFLNIPELQLISLCSPLRSTQADQAIMALERGISVYAEKPCATTEADLDRIISAAAKSDAVFHEMAGTVFEQPYWEVARQIQAGVIGEVIQVFAQKSYPMHPGRPFCEDVDGGLVMQNGVHAMRFVEHLTGLRAETISAIQTGLGENRPDSDLKMAAGAMGRLENGGIFSIIMNYLNQPGVGRWGNEEVRVFGSEGFIESIDAGGRVQMVIGENKPVSLNTAEEAPSWFEYVLEDVTGTGQFPYDLEKELHPTRMVIRARNEI